MVQSMSGVSYGNKVGAMDRVSPEKLNSRGTYSQQNLLAYSSPNETKQKSGFLNFLGKMVLTTVAVGGAALGARKLIPQIKNINLTETLAADAKFADKAKNFIAKAGEWVDTNIVKKAAKIIEDIKAKKTESIPEEPIVDIKA